MSMKSFRQFGLEIEATLRDLNSFVRQAGIYLVIVVLASGGAFLFQNNIMMDDWFSYVDNAGYQAVDTIRQGRPVFALISWLAQNSFPLHPFNTVLLYAALAVFAFAIFRRWSASPWVRLILISLFLTSPFLAEHLQFGCNQIPMAFALAMVTIWFLSINVPQPSNWPTLAVGAISAALAIATRWELLFLILGCAAIEASRILLQRDGSFRKQLTFMITSIVLSIALAVIVIVGAAYASGLGFQKSGNYGTEGLINSIDQFGPLISRFYIYWRTFLFGSHYLFPLVVKVLVLLIFLAFVLQCLLARDHKRILKVLVVIVPLSIGPLALGLITTNYPFRYTAVYPLALFPCYVTCLAVSLPHGVAWIRSFSIAAASAIVLISSANLSGAQVRLNNLNRLELSTMTQFVAQIRMVEVPDWKVAMMGKYSNPARDESRAWGWNSLECGVFDCWSNPLGSMLELTLMENNAESRVFQLTDEDEKKMQPVLDTMKVGSSRLVRLDKQHFVILLK